MQKNTKRIFKYAGIGFGIGFVGFWVAFFGFYLIDMRWLFILLLPSLFIISIEALKSVLHEVPSHVFLIPSALFYGLFGLIIGLIIKKIKTK